MRGHNRAAEPARNAATQRNRPGTVLPTNPPATTAPSTACPLYGGPAVRTHAPPCRAGYRRRGHRPLIPGSQGDDRHRRRALRRHRVAVAVLSAATANRHSSRTRGKQPEKTWNEQNHHPARQKTNTRRPDLRHHYQISRSNIAHSLAPTPNGARHLPPAQGCRARGRARRVPRPCPRRSRHRPAGFATRESRTLITIASINNTRYKPLDGRRCHAAMTSTIASVIFRDGLPADLGAGDLQTVRPGYHPAVRHRDDVDVSGRSADRTCRSGPTGPPLRRRRHRCDRRSGRAGT